jgi:ketosteroid isomerase-like protein
MPAPMGDLSPSERLKRFGAVGIARGGTFVHIEIRLGEWFDPTRNRRRQKMSHQQNVAIAQKLLEGISSGQDPYEIAAPFDADLVFEIQGDEGVLPWIGRKSGRQAIADFIRDIRALTEPVTFDVEDILASESRAAIIGALQTRIKASGKITATQFAIILTISGDVVTRFQMLEDSFDVSKAART